jgi:hypothetical protein
MPIILLITTHFTDQATEQQCFNVQLNDSSFILLINGSQTCWQHHDGNESTLIIFGQFSHNWNTFSLITHQGFLYKQSTFKITKAYQSYTIPYIKGNEVSSHSYGRNKKNSLTSCLVIYAHSHFMSFKSAWIIWLIT